MACSCKPRPVSVTPTCPTGCIVGGYHIIPAADSVGPCGQEGSFDLAEMEVNETNTTTCGAALIYKLEGWDTAGFEIVTKSGSEITFVTKSDAEEGEIYKIRYSVRCASLGLSDLGEVWVVIKNLCANVDCDAGETCNRCTGDCEETPVDVSTGSDCLNC